MKNPRKGMEVWGIWFTKHESEMVLEALEKDDWAQARVILEIAFKDGRIYKR